MAVRANWAGWTKMFPAQVCCGAHASLGLGWPDLRSLSTPSVMVCQTEHLWVGKAKEFFRGKKTKQGSPQG